MEIQGKGFKVTIEYDQASTLPLWDMLVLIEKTIIGLTLEKFGGSKARTADHLQLNRTTLVEKARKYGFPLTKPRRKRTENEC